MARQAGTEEGTAARQEMEADTPRPGEHSAQQRKDGDMSDEIRMAVMRRPSWSACVSTYCQPGFWSICVSYGMAVLPSKDTLRTD